MQKGIAKTLPPTTPKRRDDVVGGDKKSRAEIARELVQFTVGLFFRVPVLFL